MSFSTPVYIGTSQEHLLLQRPYTPTVNRSEDMVILFSLYGVKVMVTFKPFSSNASFAFAGLNARG
jgi:hypothetical protein